MTRGLPLRTQLVLLLVGVVALVVVAASLAGTAALRSYLVDRIDAELVASLDGPLDGGPGGRGPRAPRRDVSVTTLVYGPDGELTPDSAARYGRLPSGPAVDDVGELPERRPTTVGDSVGGRRWRVLAAAAGERTVVAAVPLDGVEDTASQLLVIDAAVGLLALTGGGALAWFAVRRSLRPLVVVEQTAETIAGGDLSVRVPAADPRTEVGSLAASFNAMVDRFETAYAAQQRSEAEARASEQRMRQFVGDASHELRTPLTSIRGFAELFRQGAAQDPAVLARVMRRIEDESVRMGLLVEDLLLLARLDSHRPLERGPVDLAAVAADAVHDAAVVATGHDLSSVLEPVTVPGDDARLRQVVGNLVTNAVAHTPAGTSVVVAVRREDDEAVLEVRDDGAGMPPEVAARVFERFYRADASRSRTVGTGTGSGLGLSIVAALVAAHGGTVDVTSAPGAGTAFRVRLPTLPD